VEVEDHGVGIPQKHLRRIFEPYFSTKQKGSGLGLATSYSIIKNHDGYIAVRSRVGKGATFDVYLPASNKPTPSMEGVIVEKILTGKNRILVMDDEAIIRDMLSNILGDAGYEVETSSDGVEAIKMYSEAMEAKRYFGAVIMDLTIPGGVGGKEAVKKIIEMDPDAKVIVSSGYSTDPIMSDYKKYGFSGVVTKPYRAIEIEKTLHYLLGKK
jgi:CheY-like chemotaxis protein